MYSIKSHRKLKELIEGLAARSVFLFFLLSKTSFSNLEFLSEHYKDILLNYSNRFHDACSDTEQSCIRAYCLCALKKLKSKARPSCPGPEWVYCSTSCGPIRIRRSSELVLTVRRILSVREVVVLDFWYPNAMKHPVEATPRR